MIVTMVTANNALETAKATKTATATKTVVAKTRRQVSRGFSLVELLIVIAIIAILSAIAFPAYQDYIASGRRADAQGDLLGLAQAMERFYTENGTYATAVIGAATGSIYPNVSPTSGGTTQYNLVLSNLSATTYTLTANPVGAQDTYEGPLALNHLGEKTWTDKDDVVHNCWDKTC